MRANFFGNGKCELIANFSATMVKGETGSVKGKRKERIFGKGTCNFIANLCEFLARESVNSSPILARQW